MHSMKPLPALVRLLAILPVLSGPASAHEASGSAKPLLVNPGFARTDRNGVPLGWNYSPGANNATTFIGLVRAENGSAAVKIVDRDAGVGVGLSQWVPARPGHEYALRVQIKGRSVPVYLRFHDKERKLIEPEHRVITRGGADYQWHAITAVAPARAAWVEAWVYTTSTGQTEVLVKQP